MILLMLQTLQEDNYLYKFIVNNINFLDIIKIDQYTQCNFD